MQEMFASINRTSKPAPSLQEELADVAPSSIIIAIIHGIFQVNDVASVDHHFSIPKLPKPQENPARRVLRVHE